MNPPDRTVRVLIVDDDPDDHVLTEDLLSDARKARFVALHATTVAEARDRMRKADFDVCLLDYLLGATDGVNLFVEMSAEGFAVPTILLSGSDDEEVDARVLQAGLADYLEKGKLTPTALERAILYAIERDASRRHILELNRSLEARVKERTRELEGFCYSVSHDLRAPLRAINSTSAILKEDFGHLLPPEAVAELDRQEAASARLGRLIDDLLSLMRLAQVDVDRVPFDLTALARSVADELRLDATVEAGLSAEGDPTLVRLVVQNLLDNAVKFCGGKHACVEVGRENGVFFVRDHGIGFDAKYAHKLFQPFERINPLPEFPGTGIGLANVKRIIDRHGGRVWAEGTPGQGATFFFTLA